MREIKFRVWVVPNYPKPMISSEPYMATQGDPDLETLQSFMHHYGNEKNLMQFTGLKDKNGKEIYEGDIVLVYGDKRVVEFKHAFWMLPPIESNVLGGFGTTTDAGHKPIYRYSQEDIEVIGNIHEQTHN